MTTQIEAAPDAMAEEIAIRVAGEFRLYCAREGIELPPAEFGNALNDIYPEVTHEEWRKLREWKMFVAGYNAAVKATNASIAAKYNMGQIAERLFGEQ